MKKSQYKCCGIMTRLHLLVDELIGVGVIGSRASFGALLFCQGFHQTSTVVKGKAFASRGQ